MAYITEADLHDYIKEADKDNVIDSDDAIMNSVIGSVESEVKSQFSKRYDMALELSQVGDTRKGWLVHSMTVMIIYRLLLRTNRGGIDEAYFQEYESAKKKLNQIAQGKEDSDLTLVTPDPISGQIIIGSTDDQTYDW